MFSKAKRAAKKASKAAKMIKRKVHTFVDSCELAVEKALFMKKCKVEDYMPTYATSVEFTLDYMDTEDLGDYFFLNLHRSRDDLEPELNNFDILRYGINNEDRSDEVEVDSRPETFCAATGITEHSDSAGAVAYAAQPSPCETAHLGYSDDQEISEGITDLGSSSEHTFRESFGLKEPLGQDSMTLELINLCTVFMPVLKNLGLRISRTKAPDGIAYANNIMYTVSEIIDRSAEIMDNLVCHARSSGDAQKGAVGIL